MNINLSKEQINIYLLFLELLLLQDEKYLFSYKNLKNDNINAYCGLCTMLSNNIPISSYIDNYNLIKLFKLNNYKGNIYTGFWWPTGKGNNKKRYKTIKNTIKYLENEL